MRDVGLRSLDMKSKIIFNKLDYPQDLINYRGKLELDDTNEKLKLFENQYYFNQYKQIKQIKDDYLSEEEIHQELEKLYYKIAVQVKKILQKIKKNEYHYYTFCRYLLEAKNQNYITCGITKDTLLTLLPEFQFSNAKVTDFGFGSAEILNEIIKLGSKVIGLDLSPYFVQRAIEKNIDARLVLIDDDLAGFLGDSELEPHSQDLVVSTLVLDRVYYHENYINNFLETLKYGGYFVLQTILPIVPLKSFPSIFDNLSIKEQKDLVCKLLFNKGASNIDIWELPYHVYSKDGYEKFNLYSFVGKKSK
jgi:SAM-dependent methyltransferase